MFSILLELIEVLEMQVLVVEDDVALGLFLQKGLQQEGHEVALVGDGDSALRHALEFRPDLIVLDLSLPKRDGTEVLAAMRGRFDGTAVLVLTGRSDVEERVRCLNLGADDCLLKPFSFFELTARCRALLRRRETFSDPVLRHGMVELNRMERRVTYGGRTVELTVKEIHSSAVVRLRVALAGLMSAKAGVQKKEARRVPSAQGVKTVRS
jgi:DNA-binding response OmpR family regulator